MMNEERPPNSTQFSIYGIIPYERVNGNYSLILRDEEDLGKMVAITIGSPEAQSIAIFLEDTEIDRPLTHDLICGMLMDRSIDVEWVAIDASDSDTFFATIKFSDGITMDSRPSDAISIAVRLGSPIFVDNEIMVELAFETRSVRGMERDAPPSSQDIEEEPKVKKAEKKAKKTIEELEEELDDAIKKEDYEAAAKLRDQISKRKR